MSNKVMPFVFILALLCAVAHCQTPTIVYQYANGVDGEGAVIEGSDGAYYALFPNGDVNLCGTAARLTTSGDYNVLYTFACAVPDPGYPDGAILQGGDGNFYSTTSIGGTQSGICGNPGCGTIFKLTPMGNLTVLHQFQPNADGMSPRAGLIEGSDGDFYGMTPFGGDAAQNGIIFKISASGAYTVLHVFSGGAGGSHPMGTLVQGSDGDFYGMTSDGSTCTTFHSNVPAHCGTIFKITPVGNFVVLHSFTGGTDGSQPYSGQGFGLGLVEGSDGAFYGTTQAGGNVSLCSGDGCGTIFRITSSGDFSTIYTFQGGADDSNPSGLMLASDGNLYGATANNIFRVTISGNLTTLYSSGAQFGQQGSFFPIADDLLQGDDGNFYSNASITTQGPTAFVFYRLSPNPSLPAPVQLSLTPPSIYIGYPVTLNWQVLNAFSTTMQQCYAFVRDGATGAGNWTGLQTGTLSNGIYSGSATFTPTAVGTYTYALTCGGIESGSARLVVGAIPPLVITTSSLPTAIAGTSYYTTLAAQGGIGTYTWTILSGTLPQGLSLDTATGAISGTPTQAGTVDFTVEVQDSRNPADTQTANLSLTVYPGAASLTANPSNIQIASQGNSGNTTLNVAGFVSNAIQFSCTGLPYRASCSFGSLSGIGESGTAAMQISTQVPMNASLQSPGPNGRVKLLCAWVFPGLLALAGFSRKRKRVLSALRILCVISLIAASGVLSGCGIQVNGTPPGTYSVTVSATAGTQSATTTVLLNVK